MDITTFWRFIIWKWNLKSSKYPGYSACNYDLRAEVDDGSCEYETCLGCTDNHCDETYDTKYTIPAQEFYGYGVCEPCSYLSVPTNNYPPYKSNDFAFPKKSFLYERGNVKYNKAFGELTFGYLSKDEITKSVGELRKISKQFTNYDFWLYGEVIDNIPARDIKVIVTCKKGYDLNVSELNNLIMMSISRTKKHNVCLDIRYHKMNQNHQFYSTSFPVGHPTRVSTLVPYDVIRYNNKPVEINNGKKVNGNIDLWSVVKNFPDKNKMNYYKSKKYVDHGVVGLNDSHLNKHIQNYKIVTTNRGEITPDSIYYIKNTKPSTK